MAKELSPFTFVRDIQRTHLNIYDDETKKEYVPFVINKALGNYPDCLFQANEMNRWHSLPHKMQYDYLINTIEAKKRNYREWIKKDNNEDVEAIMECYGFSRKKAREALSLLSDSQLNEIKQIITKGGVSNES